MKKKIFIWKKTCLLTIIFCLFSCSVLANEKVPYQIAGDILLSDSSVYSIAALDLIITNKSIQPIKDFTIVFYLFDEDGNPPVMKRNGFVLKIDRKIESEETANILINLDEYFSVIPDDDTEYQIDYLYVSGITYIDGTVYSDPFGLNFFY